MLNGLAAAEPGIVAQHLSESSTSLAQEMQQFSFYGRVCAMKGLLQALPEDLLCAKLHVLPNPQPDRSSPSASRAHTNSVLPGSQASAPHTRWTDSPGSGDAVSSAMQTQVGALSAAASHARQTDTTCPRAAAHQAQDKEQDLGVSHSEQDGATSPLGRSSLGSCTWLLLSEGALPACCAAVQQSTDAHHKFHAVSALAYCLDRIKQCMQVTGIPTFPQHCTFQESRVHDQLFTLNVTVTRSFLYLCLEVMCASCVCTKACCDGVCEVEKHLALI